MFGLFRGNVVKNLMPSEVAEGIAAGTMALIDVREPNETAIERFPGAVLMPLSRFDPSGLTVPPGQTVVFACASGIRSVKAIELARSGGLVCDAHLAGGLKAWKAAGLATER
jgi:rhodanese-related sulfurtransferase